MIATARGQETVERPVKLGVDALSIRYGDHLALQDVTLDVHEHEIFGIIGPANAGKTSFLKAINRMDMFDRLRCRVLDRRSARHVEQSLAGRIGNQMEMNVSGARHHDGRFIQCVGTVTVA